ncbi:rho GTPase-activating protein 20-like isoform X1 [Petromyzon marinus]|uniref:rho GTPase-activating protein 20-like isoform X1 n=1 Tax=Petromyzon marinus TaxID=7757 RepID=UPI003F6E453C
MLHCNDSELSDMSLSRGGGGGGGGGGDVSTRGPIDRPPPPRPHGLRGSLLAWAFSRVGGGPPRHVTQPSGGPWDEGGGAAPPGILFGRPLGSVCRGQQLPEAVLAMLRVLRTEGPLTGGIFRRSAGVRACRKLKQRIEAGQAPSMSGQCVLVLAAVIKDFMRSIPGGVLTEELHSEWLSAMRCADRAQRLQQIRRVSSRLPASHNALLRHVMCMLHHVARRSATNQMTPRNLAVCIAPSVAPGMHWGGHVATAGAGRLSPPSPATQSRDTAQVSLLVQFLIENL